MALERSRQMSKFQEHLKVGRELSLIFCALASLHIFYFHEWNILEAVWHDSWKIAAVWLICVTASLFPDIDTKSTSQKVIYTVLVLLDSYLLIMGQYIAAAIVGLVAMTPMLTKHRGIFHSYWMAALLPAVVLSLTIGEVSFFTLLCWASASVAYARHLEIDTEPRRPISLSRK